MTITEKLLNENVLLGRKSVTPIHTHADSARAVTFRVQRIQLAVRCDQQSARSSMVTVNCIIVVKCKQSSFHYIPTLALMRHPKKHLHITFLPLH